VQGGGQQCGYEIDGRGTRPRPSSITDESLLFGGSAQRR
jgi:hypothetical protein